MTVENCKRDMIAIKGKSGCSFKIVYCTVRLTSIDYPQIRGAYISGLRASNFIFLVCVESSSEWRTRDATIGFVRSTSDA